MPPSTTCGNPVLLEFMEEMVKEATERGYKSLPNLRKARASIAACTARFEHPSEAISLTGVGEGTVKTLTAKLEKYCKEKGLPMPTKPRGGRRRKLDSNDGNENDDDDDEQRTPSPKKRKVTRKAYVPALRSGGYAILLALGSISRENTRGLTKEEVIERAQPHCDSSFTDNQPGTYYTAWNSMDTLKKHDLVFDKKTPARRWHLSDAGWNLVDTITKSSDPNRGREDTFRPSASGPSASNDVNHSESEAEAPGSPSSIVPNLPIGAQINSTSALPKFNPIVIRAGSFTVELMVDNREVASKKDREYISNYFTEKSIKHTVAPLPIGDFLWVAKIDPAKAAWNKLDSPSNTIILDHIVERKRLDDLISSIKDRRYDEQKFRLKRAGVKNVTYLIENIRMDPDHKANWDLAVDTSIGRIQIIDKFHVKQTEGLSETLPYLQRMTKLLRKLYEDKPLYIIPTDVLTTNNHMPLRTHLRKTQSEKEFHITLEAFAALASKSNVLTLKDVFLKMLLCTKGVGAEKAVEIQKIWKTPRGFLEAFKGCDGGNGGTGMNGTTVGTNGKGKGPSVVVMTEEEKRNKKKRELVSEKLKDMVGKKKVGVQLSGKIAEVWGDMGVDVE